MQDQAAPNILDGADVRRALAGDQAAFAALYNRYFHRVYDFLARMLRDSAAAEDVTQETFIQAMTALPSLKKPEGFKSWLFTIARNQALNRLERGKRVVTMPTTLTDDGEELTLDLVDEDRQADPTLPVLDRELASLVWEAAEGLDERSYSILDLHVRQGLDSGEIAETLGVTKGNAYTMLSRVKDRFEESLAVLLVSRRGRQECEILQGIVADVSRFTPDVRDQVSKHIKSCDTCSATRRRVVVPFNIISGLAAPLPPAGLKERIWGDLITQWPPTGAVITLAHDGKDAARMRRWWRTVRRRWPLSVAALLLLLLGIVTSLSLVLGDTAPPPTLTPVPPTATIALLVIPPTPIPPTLTPVPPTDVPSTPTTAPLVIPPPTPETTATSIPAADTTVPPTDVPPSDTPVPPQKSPPTPVPAATAIAIPATPVPPPADTSASPTSAPPAAPVETPVAPIAEPSTAVPPTAIRPTVVPPPPVPPTSTLSVPTPVPLVPTATLTPVPTVVPQIPQAPPTATHTPVPPPTATFTPVPPPTATNTPIPPTATFTAVPLPARLVAGPARVPVGSAFTLTNAGGQPLTWSASATNGYTLSRASGTLAPGQSVSVTLVGPRAGSTAPANGTISITSNGGGATLAAVP
jgi:RNA polymerase sigma factor (sigma-70 family)